MQIGQRYQEPSMAALEERVQVPEDRVTALADASWQTGWKSFPPPNPGGGVLRRRPGEPVTCCWRPGRGCPARRPARTTGMPDRQVARRVSRGRPWRAG